MSAPTFAKTRYPAGHVLFERGDAAEAFYMIESGEVDLFVDDDDTHLVRLGPGEAFGEQAILAGSVRGAKAVVATDLTCTEITAQTLRQTLVHQQDLMAPVFEALLLQLYMHNAINLARKG